MVGCEKEFKHFQYFLVELFLLDLEFSLFYLAKLLTQGSSTREKDELWEANSPSIVGHRNFLADRTKGVPGKLISQE